METVRALIDRDLVVPREGHYVPADSADLDLDAIGAPASLQALVAARLDALTSPERKVVTDASVLGASFTIEGLLALGTDLRDVEGVLESLRRKEIVVLQTDRLSAERGQYRFVQSVVRQVAYATQSRRDRTARHLAAADHLAALPDPGDDFAVVIAQHLLDAVEAGASDVAGPTALTGPGLQLPGRAAVRARRVGATSESQDLLELAIAHTEEEADRARLHLLRPTSAMMPDTSRRRAPTQRPRSCSSTGARPGRGGPCRRCPELLHLTGATRRPRSPSPSRGGGSSTGCLERNGPGSSWLAPSRRPTPAWEKRRGDPVRRGDAHPRRGARRP